jgi:adenylate cyclase
MGDPQQLERKLAAIMSADVAGYSRLMGMNEAETLRRLSDLRSTVVAIIKQRGGTIAGSAGDSILAEFPSVVEAAACAIEVQQATAALNDAFVPEAKMLLRIGLNVGDVIVQEETIFGDGVNVAARLQTMAPPGGICISQLARDHLENREAYEFRDLGELSLKNIAQPVQTFELMGGLRVGRSADAEMPQNVSGAEIAFWEGIKDSTKHEEYAAYLEKYPAGHFSAIAKGRVADLLANSLPPEKALEVELMFWETVKDSDNAKQMEAYLSRYPDGQFVELAELALERMRSS